MNYIAPICVFLHQYMVYVFKFVKIKVLYLHVFIGKDKHTCPKPTHPELFIYACMDVQFRDQHHSANGPCRIIQMIRITVFMGVLLCVTPIYCQNTSQILLLGYQIYNSNNFINPTRGSLFEQ